MIYLVHCSSFLFFSKVNASYIFQRRFWKSDSWFCFEATILSTVDHHGDNVLLFTCSYEEQNNSACDRRLPSGAPTSLGKMARVVTRSDQHG